MQARIALLTILGLSVMFTVMGFIGLRNQAASMDVVLRQRQALAETVGAQVDYNIGHLLAELAAAAAEPGFDLPDADLAPEQAGLASLYRAGMFTYDVFVTDARGVVLVVEPEAGRGDTVVAPYLVGTDLSQHAHVRRALETGQPQVSGLISGVAVSGPLVSLVVPLKNANGEITGLIGGALDPGGPAISGFRGPMALGESGYAQVVDGQGMVIASTIPGRAGTPGEHRDLILSLIQRGEPTVAPDSLVTEAGKEFHEVIAFAPIARLGWAVTVEQDRTEALAPIIQARNQILLWAAIALALAMPLVWLTTRRIVRPVLAIAGAARRMASGDLTTPVTVTAHDEVGELARDFEAMRQQLATRGEALEIAVQQRTRELSTLYTIDRITAHTLDVQEILDDSLDKVLEVLQVEAGGILLLEPDGETLTLRIQRGLSDEFVENTRRIRLGEGISGRAATERRPVALDVAHYPTGRLAPVIIAEGFQTLASTPLLSGGQLVGALNLGTRRARAFPPETLDFLASIGQQLGGAVANAQLYAAEQRRAARLTDILQLSSELAALREERAILDVLVARAAILAGSPACVVLLVDAPANEAVLTAQVGLPEDTPPALRIPLDLPIIRRSLETNEPIILPDIDRDAPEMRALLVRSDVRAFFAYPMIAEGRPVGFITLSSLQPRTPSAEEITAYRMLAERAAAALENARLYQHLRASEQEYRTLVENATELIWTLDAEGCFTFVNKQAEIVSGHMAEDWLGKSFAPLIPPEDLLRVQRIFLKTLAGKAQSYQVEIYRADGGRLCLSVNTTPLYADGEVGGTISFARDVTAQKEAEAALQQRLDELTALFDVSSALRGVETVEEMLPIILQATIAVTRSDAGTILVHEPATGDLAVRAAEGKMALLAGIRLPVNDNVPSLVLRSRQPYIIRHAATETLIPPTLREQLQGIETAIVLPLQVGESAVGVMNIAYAAPHSFDEGEVRLLTAIADMAASAIRRAGLFEQLEHRVHELSALFDVGKMVTATLHIEDVLDFVVGAATRTAHAEGCYLFLWDEREERLALRAAHGFLAEDVGRMKYRLGEGLAGWVFLEGRAVNAADLAADPRWKRDAEHEAPLLSGRANNALVLPLIAGDKALGVLGVVNKTGATAFTASDETLLTTLAGQIAIAIENAHLYEDVRDLSVAAIRSLATAIDARDPYTHGHSEGVTALAVQLARELGWNGADLEMLEFAALLHDVGKIAVPDAVLRKVEPLTADEWTVIRLHPYHSAQIVKPIEPLQRIVPWIYHHHERWDGTGYPDGLQGEAIPLAARIIAVADAFSAMTIDRPYRKALSDAEARAEIERNAGKQFDPVVVQAFLRESGEM